MTPQSNFMIAAPIRAGSESALRALLSTMNRLPGIADPDNALVPFGKFETVHFARFVILKDDTLHDLERYGVSYPDAPIYLAFLGDCDGPADPLMAGFASMAGEGLRKIFGHCEGFDSNTDLLAWMRRRFVKPAAAYVNWIGRTVRQIREEASLHESLIGYLENIAADTPPRQVHAALARAVREHGPRLSPEAPTPVSWQVKRLLYVLAALGAVVILVLPVATLPLGTALLTYGAALLVLVLAIAGYFLLLRRYEDSDPDILTPPGDEHLVTLNANQDQDVTNQYNAIGAVKPQLFRRWSMVVTMALINLATPILYARGRLARVKTIHFARWVFLDGKRRMYFASNYDGSAESYMDDFVNKVPFGLNLAFSHGLGFPRTKFLLSGGAKREQEFKNTQRRHSLPTDVWYKAYPGLSLFDLERNARIRQGLERSSMTDGEIRRWLAEI